MGNKNQKPQCERVVMQHVQGNDSITIPAFGAYLQKTHCTSIDLKYETGGWDRCGCGLWWVGTVLYYNSEDLAARAWGGGG